MYKDNQIASNVSRPLPPVNNAAGTRIGYYTTPLNLFMGPQPGKKVGLPAF